MTIRKLLGTLYVQVVIAIAMGIVVGHYWPQIGVDFKPLGDGFIKLIKMIIGPIIFCTVVSGITSMHDVKQVGRVGGKALLYFEIVSSVALVIGLMAAHLLHPGRASTSTSRRSTPRRLPVLSARRSTAKALPVFCCT